MDMFICITPLASISYKSVWAVIELQTSVHLFLYIAHCSYIGLCNKINIKSQTKVMINFFWWQRKSK